MRTVTLDADIDIADALDEATDEELEKELAARGANPSRRTAVADAINEIRRGDYNDAITTLEREFFPKWGAPSDAMAAYRNERAEPKEWR